MERKKLTLKRVKRRRNKRAWVKRSIPVAAVIVVLVVSFFLVAEWYKPPKEEPQTTQIESKPTEVLEYEYIEQPQGTEEEKTFEHYEIPEAYQLTGGELPREFQEYLYQVCEQYGIEYAIALAMIEAESGYKADAIGERGDYGYFQVVEECHPERMERLGIKSIKSPKDNAAVAMDCLAENIARFESVDKALTAYNHGVTGAYRDVWVKTGNEQSKYSKKVLAKARRIRRELAENGSTEKK